VSTGGGDLVIYIDYDGVICHFEKFPSSQRMMDGAVEAVRKLKAAGHTVVIYSTRSNCQINHKSRSAQMVAEMKESLDRHGIPYDAIADHKPAWDVIIDDRAIRFKDWQQTLIELDDFQALDWSFADNSVEEALKKDGTING
jgi:Fe-S-cluster formation regulator IscX/YfhJ